MTITRVINTLPTSVRGMVVEDENGDYNIYINGNYPIDQQRKTYRHETEHIKRRHLRGRKPASACEKELK